MNFLIPQLLWALPVAALPLIIHLMSQINTKTVQFSALRFLKEMEHESIRRLRWHQWLVIFIRTMMLLLLVLLLARPVLRGYYQGLVGQGATTISLVLVDDSFSLSGQAQDPGRRGRSEAQLEALFELLSSQGDQAQVVVIRASDARIVYDGGARDLPSPRELSGLLAARFEPDYLPAVFDSVSSEAFQERARLYANRELVIISDFQTHQQDILRQWSADTTLWSDWQLLLMPIAALERNAAVTRADITTEIPIVGELMTVAVAVSNNGKVPLEDLPVQVVLNGVRAGQLVMDLDVGEAKTVRFRVVPTRPGYQEGYVEIAPDDRAGDNRFYFSAYIPTHIKLLLLDNFSKEPAYVYLALSALEAASPQIELHRLPYDDVSWSSTDFDVVILNGPLAVPRLLPRRLRDLLETGSHLVLLPGQSDNSAQAFRQIQQALGLSVSAGEPELYGEPLALDRQRTATSFMARAFSPEFRRSQGPAIHSLYPIAPGSRDDIILRLENRRPLLLRTPSSGGHVFTFAAPFDLRWNDLPLKGSYLPMWHLLVSWQPSRGSLSDIRIGESRELPVSPRQVTQTVLLEGPGNVSSRLIPDLRRRIVLLRDMHEPGIYTARFGESEGALTGIEERFSVNISAPELQAGYLSTADLTALTGTDRAFIFEQDDDVAQWVSQARFGRELWRGLLYILLLLTLTELILTNAYSTPRR